MRSSRRSFASGWIRFALPLGALIAAGCGNDAESVSTSSTSTTTSTSTPSTTSTSASTTSTTSTSSTLLPVPSRPSELRVEVVRTVPHDSAAFTQGLVFDESGRLFESTGLVGQSTIRELDPATGEVVRSESLDASLFGEGLALVDDTLIQITWQDEIAFVYDAATFEELRTFEYEGEGWGLCFDGERLVMSDGSPVLTFRDPSTFAELGTVEVTSEGAPVERLNELECVDGEVYANVWMTNDIVIIDPDDGTVSATIDASGLPRQAGADVLNGIAVAPDGSLWLTGKWWSAMYEVELVPA